MNWYVKYEGSEDIGGPFTHEKALERADAIGGIVFNEDIFSREKLVIYASVRGGCFDVELMPDGVEIHLSDYDCEGCESDRVEEDDSGDSCIVSEFSNPES